MPLTYTRPAPKVNVYPFGELWFWKCERYLCGGGRALDKGTAQARAGEHAATHEET